MEWLQAAYTHARSSLPSHLDDIVRVPDPDRSVLGARHDSVSVAWVPLATAQPTDVTLGILHVTDVHIASDELAPLLAIAVVDLSLRFGNGVTMISSSVKEGQERV